MRLVLYSTCSDYVVLTVIWRMVGDRLVALSGT